MIRQRFVFGAALVGVGMALMTLNSNAQTSTPNGTLTARFTRVLDKNDNVVMPLGSTADGEGTISVYNGGAKKSSTFQQPQLRARAASGFRINTELVPPLL